MLDLWVSETGLVRTRYNYRPNVPGKENVTFTDEVNIIKRSTTYKGNAKDRVTRALVHYDLRGGADGDKIKDFVRTQVVVDLAVESLSGRVSKIFFSRWIFREQEALSLAGRIVSRFKRGARVGVWSLDLKDDLSFEVGDLVKFNSIDLLQASASVAGSTERGQTFWRTIRKKDRRQMGNVEIELLQASTLRYAIIGPNSLPDFGAATDAEKEFGFIGDASNLVGAPPEPGYVLL